MPWTFQTVSATSTGRSVGDYTGFSWATAAQRRRLEHRPVMETMAARSRGNKEIRRRPMGRTVGITAMTGRWVRVVGLVLLAVAVAQAVVWRDASVGPLVRTVTVGRDPIAVAIAVHTGRVFVANSG